MSAIATTASTTTASTTTASTTLGQAPAVLAQVNGASGATGATGASGATGATEAGPTTGISGASGATGSSAKLANGVSGISGASGNTGPSGTSGATGATGATGPSGTTGPSGASGTGATPAPLRGAYYLIESNGAVLNYGSAGFFGSKETARLPAPVVAAALTDDGGGYWLVTARGNVYNFGDALHYGSPVHQVLTAPIVAMASTPDSGGYWLVSATGQIFNYGDAPACGAPAHITKARAIISIASSPDGQGYWLVGRNGGVYNYGDARFFGSPVHRANRSPFASFGVTPDGGGYWLVRANGAIYNYGDAGFFGSAVHVRLGRQSVVSFARSATGLGYWLALGNGRIFNYGDARFGGSLAHHAPLPPVSVVAIIASIVSASSVPALPHHVFGYDISNFQCTKPTSTVASPKLPPTSSISVLEAAGWLDGATNPCLADEAHWATRAAGPFGAPYELYLFLNSPGTNAAATVLGANGPRGACADYVGALAGQCFAYNYGYNGAHNALTYATSVGVHSLVWWVDIENALLSKSAYSNFAAGQYWSDYLAYNDAVIEGAITALRSGGVTVGIYSTSVQYPKIAGSYSPDGPPVPLWIAGVPWTKPPYTEAGLISPTDLATWCDGSAIYAGTKSKAAFAGGVPWILQETPGSIASPYNLDPDYTC